MNQKQHEKMVRQQEQQGVELRITFRNGGVQVYGPIQDKGLCYMMLEMAKDAIREFNAPREVNASHDVPPAGIALPDQQQVRELGKAQGGGIGE